MNQFIETIKSGDLLQMELEITSSDRKRVI
jgi:hypothetical protein